MADSFRDRLRSGSGAISRPAPAVTEAIAIPAQRTETVAVSSKPSTAMLLTGPVGGPGYVKSTWAELKEQAAILEQRLAAFGAKGKVVRFQEGPIITNFEFEPNPDVKIARVMGLANDIALALKVTHVRFTGSIEGKGTIGIEVPNKSRRTVILKDVLDTAEFRDTKMHLPLGFGLNSTGSPVVVDLTTLPHLLVAGETGAGKSVFVNSLIVSLIIKHTPETLRMILIDPKRVELSIYNGIPHLIDKVIVTPEEAIRALARVVRHMKSRYQLLEESGARNLEDYNANTQTNKLPYLVVIIDELADLMLTNKKVMEYNIARIAQMARAVGIHLILATQRPSVNIITGIIKANFPARVAFRVASGVDSRVILDMHGAETLLGRGDMLWLSPAKSTPERVHGPFCHQVESMRLVTTLTAQGPGPRFQWFVVQEDFEENEETDELETTDSESVTVEFTQKVTMTKEQSRSWWNLMDWR